MRRTIAIVDDVSIRGGVARVIGATIGALVDHCDVAVLCPDGEVVDGYRSLGATWTAVEFGDRSLRGRNARAPSPSQLLELRRARHRLRAALTAVGATDAHVMAKYPRVAMAGSENNTWPRLTWHVHEVLSRTLAWLPSPAHLLAVSEAAADPFRRRQALRRRVQVVPNPVDLERFRPASAVERVAARRDFGIVDDRSVLAVIARITSSKAIEVVLRAVAGAAEPIVVLVAGSPGPEARDVAYDAQLRGEAARLGVDARFLGARDDVERVIRASDLAVSASRWEGFGIGVAEALASGVPVVATDVGGHRDVVNGRVGVLVPVDDEDSLRNAVMALLADDPRRRTMASEGPRLAATRWSAHLYRERIRAVHGFESAS